MPPSDDPLARLRRRVDAFVARTFSLRGTLSLHRAALGWDLLRAPLNVALAPVFLLSRLLAWLLRLLGLRRAGAWLGTRRILLPTAVARAVETRIAGDLLDGADLTPRSRDLIADYTGIRSAVAEITTSLFVLLTGALLFGAATPGVVSLAPRVTELAVRASAVANFPLGARLGEVWYGVFPVTLPISVVIATGVVLATIGSLVTTFAGVIADPVQARLGIHRRRLLRLLSRIAEAEGTPAGLAPEHLLARLADLADAGVSLARIFRP